MKRRIRDVADARLELEEPTQPGPKTTPPSTRLAWFAASADGRRIVGAVSRSTSALWRGTIDERPIDESRATRVGLPTTHGVSPRLGPDYVLYRASTAGADGLWKVDEGQKPTEL